MSSVPRAMEWIGGCEGRLRLLDQTLLPAEVTFRDCGSVADVWEAIRSLRVRGAPAIGVAAAYGVVIGAQSVSGGRPEFRQCVHDVAAYLRSSRPTAVNLSWALERMERRMGDLCEPFQLGTAVQALLDEANAIADEDRRMCLAIGRFGAALVPDVGGVLTHCNAGSLATAGDGTALSILYAAAESGRQFKVFVDETRPLLQGSRLTAWELLQHGLDVTLICDNMAARVMGEGRIGMVVVGADRIAANGDTANKIGTYGVALLAAAHDIPFYVAAPSSTFDLSLATGDQIPIEQRDAREVTHGFGPATAPAGVKVYNPAFDVTPARLITAIVTEKGIIQPVTPAAILNVLNLPSQF